MALTESKARKVLLVGKVLKAPLVLPVLKDLPVPPVPLASALPVSPARR
jgi:hypothetical protein